MILARWTLAKAFVKNVFINQERRLGDRRWSDTVVVPTINDADQGLGGDRKISFPPKRTNERTNEWMNQPTNKQTNKKTDKQFSFSFFFFLCVCEWVFLFFFFLFPWGEKKWPRPSQPLPFFFQHSSGKPLSFRVLGGVWSQVWNLKALTEGHTMKWSLRLNLTQHGEPHQVRT